MGYYYKNMLFTCLLEPSAHPDSLTWDNLWKPPCSLITLTCSLVVELGSFCFFSEKHKMYSSETQHAVVTLQKTGNSCVAQRRRLHVQTVSESYWGLSHPPLQTLPASSAFSTLRCSASHFRGACSGLTPSLICCTVGCALQLNRRPHSQSDAGRRCRKRPRSGKEYKQTLLLALCVQILFLLSFMLSFSTGL